MGGHRNVSEPSLSYQQYDPFSPFPKRTIRLVKILALIVGATGVMGALSEIGLAWYFAAVPAAAVVFLALKEKVEEVVILRPPSTRASYLPAWESYLRLRGMSSFRMGESRSHSLGLF